MSHQVERMASHSLRTMGVSIKVDVNKQLLKNYLTSDSTAYLYVFIIAILAVVIYWFKENQKLLYGLIECAAALATCYVACQKIQITFVINKPATLEVWATLIGSIYFIVRGIDNCVKGWNSENWLIDNVKIVFINWIGPKKTGNP